MEFRSLTRPASRLLTTTTTPRITTSTTAATVSWTCTRGHKTTARTKRSLKMAPHDSFLPDRAAAFPAADAIIYNPPASAASPFHTPFLFLPRNDPRRAALTRLRHTPGSPLAVAPSEAALPPEMRYRRRSPNYSLSAEDVKEMKRLRGEDPVKWSAAALAERFHCSNVFVRMAAPAPQEHLQALKAKEARREARWGPIRTAAREARKRRTEMLYRGEL